MWPLPKKSVDHISIVFEADRVIFCALSQEPKRHMLTLKAFEEFICNDPQTIQGTLFNPTYLGNQIRSFIQKNKLKNPTIACSLSDDSTNQYLISRKKTIPEISTLEKTHNTLYKKAVYLYPHDNQLLFYVVEIPHALLLQYKVWAIRYKLSLTTMMSGSVSLLALYQYIYGPAYRPAQLAQHLKQKNNDISLLFSSDLLERILHMPGFRLPNNHHLRLTLFKACGLFVTKGIEG